MGTPARGQKFTPAQGRRPRAGVNFWPRAGVPHSFPRAGQGSAIPVISGAGAGVELGGVQQWVLLHGPIVTEVTGMTMEAFEPDQFRNISVQFASDPDPMSQALLKL